VFNLRLSFSTPVSLEAIYQRTTYVQVYEHQFTKRSETEGGGVWFLGQRKGTYSGLEKGWALKWTGLLYFERLGFGGYDLAFYFQDRIGWDGMG